MILKIYFLMFNPVNSRVLPQVNLMIGSLLPISCIWFDDMKYLKKLLMIVSIPSSSSAFMLSKLEYVFCLEITPFIPRQSVLHNSI